MNNEIVYEYSLHPHWAKDNFTFGLFDSVDEAIRGADSRTVNPFAFTDMSVMRRIKAGEWEEVTEWEL